MKFIVYALLLSTLACRASSGSIPGGELLGRVVDVEPGRIDGTPWTVCKVVVFCDSSASGSPFAPGDTVQLWMPGGGRSVAILDGPGFALSTVPMVSGEKVFVCYRTDGRRLAIEKKWTVWTKSSPQMGSTAADRERSEREDVRLEALLAAKPSLASLQDSLELFTSGVNENNMMHPVPGPGMSWRDYGLLTVKAGSLRSVRESLAILRSEK